MGKKKLRKKYVSQGGLGGHFGRNEKVETSVVQREINKLDAFAKGKNVYFTVPVPGPTNSNKKWKRVKGKSLYGDFRDFSKGNDRSRPAFADVKFE